ncbi:outer membrane porin GjpA [Mycolicibacter heraklionensis]|uniref:outer membrane porin GjpA n=1 Tax=Mycolicibacter heraklionensis TaxID=512402 RepID=UPI000B229007|nr:outer membrane porin GjpA [Mycolicibacter heraklionensis]
MHRTARRPWIPVGLALLGAGTLAATPVALPTPNLHNPAVQLTAGEFDPIIPWVDAFNTASANVTALSDFFFEAPAATWQQAIVNQIGYLGQLVQNPGSIGDIFTQIGDHLQTASESFVLGGAPDEVISATLPHTLEAAHTQLYNLLPLVLEAFLQLDPATVDSVMTTVDYLASPLSGVLMGLVGPFVSPIVELVNSVEVITDDLSGDNPDVTAALNDLINIPANLTNAFLNGATLDLSGLLPLLSEEGILPEGVVFTSLGIAFGGLLTPGATDGTIPDNLGIGGSLFNALAFVMQSPLPAGIGGVPVGPMGALESLSQILAGAIGWDGTGNPLADLTFPTLPTDVADPGDALSTDLGWLGL